MTQNIEWAAYQGETLYDADGNVVGRIEEFFVETDDDPPAWVLVVSETDDMTTDEMTRSYVPMRDARRAEDGRGLQVSVDSDAIHDAPGARNGEDLSENEERQLYEHYGQPHPDTKASGKKAEDNDKDASAKADNKSHKPGLLRRLLGRV